MRPAAGAASQAKRRRLRVGMRQHFHGRYQAAGDSTWMTLPATISRVFAA
jgi:hypothetical protein